MVLSQPSIQQAQLHGSKGHSSTHVVAYCAAGMHEHNYWGDGQQLSKVYLRPILDCIDIHLDVPRVPVQKFASLDGGEPSNAIR